MAGACIFDALLDQLRKVNRDVLPFARTRSARLEDLLDRIHQAVAILQHQAIEGLALGLIEFSAFQGLQMQADRGDRSL